MRDYKHIKGTKLEKQIKGALTLHDQMKGAYFYTPPSIASMRRSYEKRNSMNFTFSFRGDIYEVNLSTDCSCKIVYYKGYFAKNGKTGNVRLLKTLIA